MPHRVNTTGDIGNALVKSDSYDADHIYLSEEGWVYRHYKNDKKTKWWDEIIVGGQVIPDEEIGGINNGEGKKTGEDAGVIITNPLKLGAANPVPFETGDGQQEVGSVGTISINGVKNVNVNESQTYTWKIEGGSYAKAQTSHTWYVIDKNDDGSLMSGEATITNGFTEESALVKGISSGAVKIGIEVTVAGITDPIIVTYPIVIV